MHLYLPTAVFARLKDDYNLSALPGRSSIRYSCGVQDELINRIGRSVLAEMMSSNRCRPHARGNLVAAARGTAGACVFRVADTSRCRHTRHIGWMIARLRRVLAYIEENLVEDIAVADLANVACLSIFHFTRAFTAAMGVPPHRYVSRRRLETARAMIATGSSLSKIAFNCRFSSESSFTRAFRRAMGMTPAAYRRTLR